MAMYFANSPSFVKPRRIAVKQRSVPDDLSLMIRYSPNCSAVSLSIRGIWRHSDESANAQANLHGDVQSNAFPEASETNSELEDRRWKEKEQVHREDSRRRSGAASRIRFERLGIDCLVFATRRKSSSRP
ncbi:hypothetical protein HN011_003540 [Eciton burchellii]|nr:hypothetical protein HN011_003540 [Eciton burchellii]